PSRPASLRDKERHSWRFSPPRHPPGELAVGVAVVGPRRGPHRTRGTRHGGLNKPESASDPVTANSLGYAPACKADPVTRPASCRRVTFPPGPQWFAARYRVTRSRTCGRPTDLPA